MLSIQKLEFQLYDKRASKKFGRMLDPSWNHIVKFIK